MPKLDAFSKLMLACGLFAVATAVLGGAVLEQAAASPCAAGSAAAGLGLLAVWPMLALAGGTACWAALRGMAGCFAALAKRWPRRASPRAAAVPGASAAVLRFPAVAVRRAAAAPRPTRLDGQIVTLRPARRAPWRRMAVTPKPALEHECWGEC